MQKTPYAVKILSFEAKEALISFLLDAYIRARQKGVENSVFVWCFSNEEIYPDVITGPHNSYEAYEYR